MSSSTQILLLVLSALALPVAAFAVATMVML